MATAKVTMMKKIADTNSDMSFKPTAYIKEKDAMLEGTLTNLRQVKTEYGMKPVYTLQLKDYNCKITQDDAFVEPKEGTEVEFFAPTRLARQLDKVGLNKLVRITYLGQKKVGKGNPAHIFEVLVGE